MVSVNDYIICEGKEFNGKIFVSVINSEVDTDTRRMLFEAYVPKGYRLPTAEELDQYCNTHPFFESMEEIPQGHMFVNDLGLKIYVRNYIDDWSGCIYGPMVICKESIQKQYQMKVDMGWFGHVEECYDIRERRYRQWFDYRVLRHLILVKE